MNRLDERTYELYKDFSQHIDFESELLEKYEIIKKLHDYEIVRKQLSLGVPEKVIAKAFQLTAKELKILKK